MWQASHVCRPIDRGVVPTAHRAKGLAISQSSRVGTAPCPRFLPGTPERRGTRSWVLRITPKEGDFIRFPKARAPWHSGTGAMSTPSLRHKRWGGWGVAHWDVGEGTRLGCAGPRSTARCSTPNRPRKTWPRSVFPELFDAIRASVATVLSSCDVAKAFRLLVEDLPRMLIRERPPRSIPRMLQRPWPRLPDPQTRYPQNPRRRPETHPAPTT